MRYFARRLDRALQEGMGTAEYSPPGKASQLMADFYLLSLMQSMKADVSHRTEELRYEVDAAQKVLVPHLRQHLLRAAGYGILCELRHVFDSADTPQYAAVYEGGVDEYDTDLEWTWEDEEERKLQMMEQLGVDRETSAHLKMLSQADQRPTRDYATDERCLAAATAGAVLFQDGKPLVWQSQYGGRQWVQGCKSWLSLHHASGLGDSIAYIDKLYSTQHNNGSLLDKNPEYEGSWVKAMLDLKFAANEPEELLPFASPFVRRLGRMILVNSTHKGWSGKPSGAMESGVDIALVKKLQKAIGTSFQLRYSVGPGGVMFNVTDLRPETEHYRLMEGDIDKGVVSLTTTPRSDNAKTHKFSLHKGDPTRAVLKLLASAVKQAKTERQAQAV